MLLALELIICMPTASLTYMGGLRTRLQHEKSGQEIFTDAPVDNHGKGEAFSPTDLLSGALIACMVTIVGILAESKNLALGQVTGTVNKFMAESPRRVSALQTTLTFTGNELSLKERQMVENAAMNCPVVKSLHTDIAVSVRFIYE